MRRYSLVAIFFALFVLATQCVHADPLENQENNAATHYLKAADLLKNFKSDEIKAKVKKIGEEGWAGYEKEVETLILENEPCLKEIKKGLSVPKCDFYFGKKDYKAFFEEIPAPAQLLSLPWVLLLNGLYREHQMKYEEAVGFYLESLTFANQIEQDKSVLSRIVVVETEKNAYPLISGYVTSKNADRELTRKIADYLVEYEKNHYPAREVIETFKELYLSSIQLLCEGLNKKVASDNKYDEDMKKHCYNFSDMLLQQARELADRYYGNFVIAADSNKDSDWKFAEDEFNKFTKVALSDNISKVKDITAFVLNSASGKRAENSKLIASRVSAFLLAGGTVSSKYRDAVNRVYYNNHEMLMSLISTANERSK